MAGFYRGYAPALLIYAAYHYKGISDGVKDTYEVYKQEMTIRSNMEEREKPGISCTYVGERGVILKKNGYFGSNCVLECLKNDIYSRNVVGKSV